MDRDASEGSKKSKSFLGCPEGSPVRKLPLVSIFAIAMGYLEAVVVVYIRHILHLVPIRSEWQAAQILSDPKWNWLFFTERTREVSTIVMLVIFAFLVGKSRLERLGIFLWAFGIWDIFYYIGLYAHLRWPPSLLSQDILFLIPCPWKSPVIVPVTVSLIMLGIGLFILQKYC